MSRTRSIQGAVLLAVLLLVASGCGADTGANTGADTGRAAGADGAAEPPGEQPTSEQTSGPAGTPTGAPSSRPSDGLSGGLALPTSPPTTPTDAGTKLRLVGEVVAEGTDYVVLRDANGMKWALLGDLATVLRTGPEGPVQVTGRSRIDTDRDGLPVVLVDRVDTRPQRS